MTAIGGSKRHSHSHKSQKISSPAYTYSSVGQAAIPPGEAAVYANQGYQQYYNAPNAGIGHVAGQPIYSESWIDKIKRMFGMAPSGGSYYKPSGSPGGGMMDSVFHYVIEYFRNMTPYKMAFLACMVILYGGGAYGLWDQRHWLTGFLPEAIQRQLPWSAGSKMEPHFGKYNAPLDANAQYEYRYVNNNNPMEQQYLRSGYHRGY